MKQPHATFANAPAESRGQSMVEFAVVVVFLTLFLMGIFDLGRAVYYYNVISASAREAARQAIVHTDDCSTADPSIISSVVATAAGTPLTTSNVQIASCPRIYGDPLTVTITLDFVPITPLIGRFGGSAFTMHAQSTMITE
jgi:Flp pilus assembly protein TadG